MDQIDERILRELRDDGRMTWVELAERVSLSAPACQRRVQALVADGVVERFTLRIKPEAVGYEVEAFVSVNVDRRDVEEVENFRRAVRRYPEVQDCHMLTGQVDYLLRVFAPDLKSYGRFIEDKILALPGVTDASTSLVLDRIKTS